MAQSAVHCPQVPQALAAGGRETARECEQDPRAAPDAADPAALDAEVATDILDVGKEGVGDLAAEDAYLALLDAKHEAITRLDEIPDDRDAGQQQGELQQPVHASPP